MHTVYFILKKNKYPAPVCVAELLYFNHTGGFLSMNCHFKTLLLGWIQVRILTRPLQHFSWLFFEPFRCGFNLMHGIIFLLRNPVVLEFQFTD